MHTVIVSPDIVGPIRNGGIGTFAHALACLLRTRGERVTIVFTGPVERSQASWQDSYRERGIETIRVSADGHPGDSRGNWWFVRRSQAVADAMPKDADIVYVQDWHANGFLPLRKRRFCRDESAVYVNVLHSSSAWLREGMREYAPDFLEGLSLDFAERYVAQHADFVLSPSRYMLDWARENGWSLPPGERTRALGYPVLFDAPAAPAPEPQSKFKRIVFFGRIERRKGLDLFADSLEGLVDTAPSALGDLAEIVLLGKRSPGSRDAVARIKRSARRAGARAPILDNLATFEARAYLAERAADSLVVMPSLIDNYPYAAIETSLIPGARAILSDAGGIPEIFGPNAGAFLFEPTASALQSKLTECLAAGPRRLGQLPPYDVSAHNAAWLAFHDEISRLAAQRRAAPNSRVASIPTRIRANVCVPYHNNGKHLPHTLAALARQTATDFDVTVVNDASTDAESQRVFGDMKTAYAHKGWRFLSNSRNMGLSETRTIAAAAGDADYALFVDADNVPFPCMVERFCEAIAASGDDCLTCYMRAFRGDSAPYELDGENGDGTAKMRVTAKTYFEYLPLGAALDLALFENVLGDANFIVKREVFEKLGGFTVEQPWHRRIVHEDYAFLTRLAFAGYKLDVVPEPLFFYRCRRDSLSNSTDLYLNTMRVHDIYRRELRKVGLESLACGVYGLYERQRRGAFLRGQLAAHWRTPLAALWFIIAKVVDELRRARR